MIKKGIDVSYAQGNIDWSKVKTDFAILRAGFGKLVSQKDATFEANYKGCKVNNIPCGAYWYSYAMNEAEAVQEAKACIEVIKGKQFEYPIYFDIEEAKQFDLGKEKCSAIAKAFLDTIEKAGYWVGIYCSTYWLTRCISEELRKRYAVWVAQYSDTCTYSGNYGIWQYSGDSETADINGDVDADYAYVDYPTLIKNKGLNGFKKPSGEKILDSTGRKKGNKDSFSLKGLLLLAKDHGIQPHNMDVNAAFGDGTEKAVNYLLKKWGYKENGIAGSNFEKRLIEELRKKVQT